VGRGRSVSSHTPAKLLLLRELDRSRTKDHLHLPSTSTAFPFLLIALACTRRSPSLPSSRRRSWVASR
jgi:hypothetical protein